MRPGLGHIFRGHALGAIRMAFLLHRSWRRQHGLLVPWFAWIPLGRTVVSRVEQSGAGFLELLMQRSMWGTCGGLFGANYVLYFEITWLPFYLVRERHLSMGTMAKIGGLGYLCYAAAAVVFGWISDRWIADSCSQNFCACRSGDCRAIPPWLHPRRSHGLCYSAATSVRSRWHVRIQYLAITQTLAGPRMAGRWTGWQNSLGNLAGVSAPAVTGFVIDYTGRSSWHS